MTIATTEPRPFHLLHVTGPRNAEAISPAASKVEGWTMVPYEDDMARFYAACDLVISRAGALTIAELEETSTPAIVVPLPAGKGYQRQNADDLVASGGAMLIEQGDPNAIVASAFALMADDAHRTSMAAKAGATGHRHAAAEVARLTRELLNV